MNNREMKAMLYPEQDRELKALIWAEKYGIIEYKVKGNKMVYLQSFRLEHNTYKVEVDLTTMKESRVRLARYYKVGEYNN